MDFTYSERVNELRQRLLDFMERYIYPNQETYRRQIEASGNPHHHAEIVDELKQKAKAEGLWNLFMTDPRYGPGLSNLEYAPLAEIMGRVSWASEVFNCAAPDTGNMEILAEFGTPEQKEQWLKPLLEGEIRSAFAMTEPDVASSDATNIQLTIERQGDEYVLNGRKWWISGAARPRCKIFIVMGKTDPHHPDRHRQQSMILVPRDTPGVTIVRSLPVMGYLDNESHCEVRFENVRVPASNLLGEEGSGFAIAQARLGPGRIHHCMRAIGAAQYALELMCRRAQARVAFGKPLAEQGVIQEWIAQSHLEIEQARLLTLKAAWMMDTLGKKAAQKEIAMIKIVAPTVMTNVVNRAIQVFGAAGLCDDFPLASMWAHGRTLHIVDGPDEVHKRSLARLLLREQRLPQA
ncbi:MAG: acyl-CoA dehydrogenase family protein [Thermogemmatispora sp.]|jgi:acyl-CoA dehydrogenase|uniref:Acyl-CoA dehydrogenase n=1 Tax=Thermogemmatispora aurantia TaxID=2045279 RepID=A0A5J4KGY0_9CHLR|nr:MULTISPECIES: acyl-CoA dehydrogenase family protein [Thermogemmatispora]MBE3566014.1 acyl-CoA dehydrogenase family protein [Thermogemmatispora sp.]GER85056.1 acyl-CoA dehydrogenase [Thermogemmatispora aurantia]